MNDHANADQPDHARPDDEERQDRLGGCCFRATKSALPLCSATMRSPIGPGEQDRDEFLAVAKR